MVTFAIGKDKTFICQNLENAGPLGQKCTLFIPCGFDHNKALLKYFYIFIFCSGRAFQPHIDNDNPTLVLDMASENIKCASNFWTDYKWLRKNDLILIMSPEEQDKTSELSKHWSPDSTPKRNQVIMKTIYPVNQYSATKSVVIREIGPADNTTRCSGLSKRCLPYA